MKLKNIVLLAAMLVMTQTISAQELSIKVYGACGMCQERIESNAKSVIGVNTASWDQEENKLTITYVEGFFQENELHQKMISIGHDTDQMKSPDEIYDNLHACCKYRVDENTEVENQVEEKVKIDLPQTTKANELSIKVYGACGMCQERIESNAKNVIGVNTASWDQEENMLTITFVNGFWRSAR